MIGAAPLVAVALLTLTALQTAAAEKPEGRKVIVTIIAQEVVRLKPVYEGPTADTMPPLLQTATVDGASLMLTYDENLNRTAPATKAFKVNNGGRAPQAVTNVAIVDTTVTLTLDPGVAVGDAPTVSYTAGAAPIQDVATNAAANLTNQGVNSFRSGDEPVLLRFRTDALPANIPVDKATLRLVCQNKQTNGDGRVKVDFFTAYETGPANVGEGKNFGSKGVGEDKPKENEAMEWTPTLVPMELKGGADGKTSFALMLETNDVVAGRQWYSTDAKKSENRPRLILEYTIPDQPAVTQTEGVPATHSSGPFLPTADSKPWLQVISHPIITTGVWSHTPVFYKGRVFLITRKDSRFELQALSPLGGSPLPPVSLTNPGQHLVLSDSGRLAIVGKGGQGENGQILVYQLDPAEVDWATEISLPNPKEDRPAPNPALPPAVGQDGSLYVVNGQEVYGLNSDLQELWKVTLDHTTTSRVTVGPSGAFVYLIGQEAGVMSLIAIDARTGETSTVPLPNAGQLKLVDNPTLHAIDARTGETSTVPLPNAGQLKSVDNPTLHAPVVLRHSDGTEKIYVAAHSPKGGKLSCFDNPKTRPRNGDKGLELAENWEPLTGHFSQPTVGRPTVQGDRKIYSVKVTGTEGRLTALGWLDGKEEAVGAAFTVAESDSVGATHYLLNKGNLAVDRDGNVFVWNGMEGKLYASTLGSPALLGGKGDPAEEAHLFFGTNGTLYAANENRELRAILPIYTIGQTTPSGSVISSPTHLRVNGTVEKDTTLSAGGSVLLGKGFTVQQGATLAVGKP